MRSLLESEMISKSHPPQRSQEITDEIIDTFFAHSDRATIIPLTVARASNFNETLNKALEDEKTCSLDVLFSHVRVLRLRQPSTNGELKVNHVWLLWLFTKVTELELRDWSFGETTVNQLARTLGHFGRTIRRLRLANVNSPAKILMHLGSLFHIANDIEVRMRYITLGMDWDCRLVPACG